MISLKKINKIDEYESAIKLSAHNELFFGYNDTDGNIIPVLICNDVFGYATADAEETNFPALPYMWENYRLKGNKYIIQWIVDKRKMKPLEQIQTWLEKQEDTNSYKELEVLYNPDEEQDLDEIIRIYEKCFEYAADDKVYFLTNGNKITLNRYSNKRFIPIDWNDIFKMEF